MGRIGGCLPYKPEHSERGCPLLLAPVDRRFRRLAQPTCIWPASPTQTHCRTARRSGEASAYAVMDMMKENRHRRRPNPHHAGSSQKDVHPRPDPEMGPQSWGVSSIVAYDTYVSGVLADWTNHTLGN